MGGLEHARENRQFATSYRSTRIPWKQASDRYLLLLFFKEKKYQQKKLLFTPIYLIGALTTADLKAILFQQNNGKSISVSQLLSF